MAKVSIGLRGWRFDEEEVFDEDGNIRPLTEMDDDTVYRLIRLSSMMGEPCDACWLVHGEEEIEQANPATIVYGEPMAEVVLCDEHEADFLYWFREEGGDEYQGSGDLPDAFHEWFLDGNRAPEGYGGLEHVDEAPGDLPEAPEPPDAAEKDGIPEVDEQLEEMEEAEQEALDIDTDALDI
jgi:hypothetical protein